jgi:hypothetical protein
MTTRLVYIALDPSCLSTMACSVHIDPTDRMSVLIPPGSCSFGAWTDSIGARTVHSLCRTM